MPKYNFHAHQRFIDFTEHLRKAKVFSLYFFIYLVGWFLSFYATSYMLEDLFPQAIPFLIILFYFWFKLLSIFHQDVRPPNELLIILFIILALLEISWLNLVQNYWSSTGSLQNLLQILLLAFTVLIFSIILVENSSGKRRVIFFYILLAIIGIPVLRSTSNYFWYIYQVILFLLIIRKTIWTEELTKFECWIYLVIFFLLYQYFPGSIPNINADIGSQTNLLWTSIPLFLIKLFKIYLLAVLVRIPFVLIYNHASLSRKLRIASKLQSSIPQVIQFILLLMVFYFFIAGWQAENARSEIEAQLEQIKNQTNTNQQQFLKLTLTGNQKSLTVPNYQPIQNFNELPSHGIISLKRNFGAQQTSLEQEYFIFFESTTMDQQHFYLVKLDSTYLNRIRQGLPLLAATHLTAYPFEVNQLDSILYQIRIWQGDTRFQYFRIFPFGITPYQAKQSYTVPLPQSGKRISGKQNRLINNHSMGPMATLGRIFIPLYNSDSKKSGFWAFDITLLLSWSLFTSAIAKQLGFWLILYFLINLLIIRQVAKFGDQIQTIIIQKFNQLKNGIRQISEGNLDYKISLEGEDEFVELAERFNQMGDDLKETIAELREKDRLEYELKIAREVQLNLLPKTIPTVEGFQIAAGIRTANEVGGDFYDVLPLDNGRFLFVIGDVSGKSTSAAFYMAQFISLVRFSRQFSDQLREILLRLNKYFADAPVNKEIFVTAILGILDTKKSKIQLFRAGHPHPILLSNKTNKTLKEIKTPGLGIGLERSGKIFEKILKDAWIKLDAGDTFISYTDGIVEAAYTSNGEENIPENTVFFGEDELKASINKHAHLNARGMLDNIFRDLDSFYGNHSFIDDCTLLIIKKES